MAFNGVVANPGLAMINAAIEHDIDAQNQILIIIGKALKNKRVLLIMLGTESW